MKVAFRVDASVAIGSGHLMRCFALADELHERGAAILFVIRAAEQAWQVLLRQHHLEIVTLPENISDWTQDAAETRIALDNFGSPDWLVVDHYALGIEWEAAMRDSCGRIFVIDDIGRHHDCDLLLDQNILDHPESYRDRVPAHCRRLLGPSYALLRREFREERARLRNRDGSVRRVLISFGGSDPTGETEKAIEGFLAAGFEGIIADVVLGSANLRAAEINQRFATQPRVHLIPHTHQMASLMAEADLGIGASGSSSWERCCLGLPSISVAVAENQQKLGLQLHRKGAVYFLGAASDNSAIEWQGAIIKHSIDAWLRPTSIIALSLVDGLGSSRIADGLFT